MFHVLVWRVNYNDVWQKNRKISASAHCMSHVLMSVMKISLSRPYVSCTSVAQLFYDVRVRNYNVIFIFSTTMEGCQHCNAQKFQSYELRVSRDLSKKCWQLHIFMQSKCSKQRLHKLNLAVKNKQYFHSVLILHCFPYLLHYFTCLSFFPSSSRFFLSVVILEF